MEALRKIGEIIRNHYEKIILTIVLIGLALAVLYVNQTSRKEAEKIKASVQELAHRKEKLVEPIDLSESDAALKRMQTPSDLAFSGPHNLVNPVKWKKKTSGEVYKVPTEAGVWEKMVITRRAQLRFIVAYDRAANPGYWLKITKEAAERPNDRRPKQIYLTLNTTNRQYPTLILRTVTGAPDKPDELGLELVDTTERIAIATNRAFERIEAYEADLKNTLMSTNNVWLNLRQNSIIRIQNDEYIIVAINENELVASDRNTGKYYHVTQFAPATTNVTNRATPPVQVPAPAPPPVVPPGATGVAPPPPGTGAPKPP
jgi:hypothetical protein